MYLITYFSFNEFPFYVLQTFLFMAGIAAGKVTPVLH